MVYDFGMRMRELRESKKLTQGMVAETLGVTPALISRYEANVSYPSVPQLKRLALLYGVTTDYILGLEDRPTLIVDIPERHRAFLQNTIQKLIFDFIHELDKD